MTKDITLHIIIGKWRTRNHSTKNEFDDTHKIKKKILKRVGKKNYSKQVGTNPDLDINRKDIIILKGTGLFKKKPNYETCIDANDHFVIRFIPLSEVNEIEVQILIPDSDEEDNQKEIHNITHFDKLFLIPNNDQMISLLIEILTKKYLKEINGQTEEIAVVYILK